MDLTNGWRDFTPESICMKRCKKVDGVRSIRVPKCTSTALESQQARTRSESNVYIQVSDRCFPRPDASFNYGMWKQWLWSQRHNCGSGDSHGGPCGCAAGKQPGFCFHGSFQGPMHGSHGGAGNLELDGKRSLGPSLGCPRHAGDRHLHGGDRKPGHHYGHLC